MVLADDLPQPARLQTEARYREMNGDWTQAVEIYSRLQQSYPDNLDYGLDLASRTTRHGQQRRSSSDDR